MNPTEYAVNMVWAGVVLVACAHLGSWAHFFCLHWLGSGVHADRRSDKGGGDEL